MPADRTNRGVRTGMMVSALCMAMSGAALLNPGPTVRGVKS